MVNKASEGNAKFGRDPCEPGRQQFAGKRAGGIWQRRQGASHPSCKNGRRPGQRPPGFDIRVADALGSGEDRVDGQIVEHRKNPRRDTVGDLQHLP